MEAVPVGIVVLVVAKTEGTVGHAFSVSEARSIVWREYSVSLDST